MERGEGCFQTAAPPRKTWNPKEPGSCPFPAPGYDLQAGVPKRGCSLQNLTEAFVKKQRGLEIHIWRLGEWPRSLWVQYWHLGLGCPRKPAVIRMMAPWSKDNSSGREQIVFFSKSENQIMMLISQSCLRIKWNGTSVHSINTYRVSTLLQGSSLDMMGREREREKVASMRMSVPKPSVPRMWGRGYRTEQGLGGGLCWSRWWGENWPHSPSRAAGKNPQV